jgi:hypothetical protein
MLALDQDRTAHVHRLPQHGRELTCVAVKTVRRRGRGVGEAELDGDARDRLRCSSSSDSLQQLAPGWSNAAALRPSSTAPALQSSTN